MTKQEYDKNRPRKVCPICGKDFTAANYEKHYTACSNPSSKLNRKKNDVNIYRLDHDTLECKFCNKDCKNKNSLAQHELRCKLNPNRKSYTSFSEYVSKNRKGKTSETCEEIRRAQQSLINRYKNGYSSPLKGKKVSFEYYYEKENKAEIQKWLDYVKNCVVYIPRYILLKKNDSSYNVISKKSLEESLPGYLFFEHNFIANIYLKGQLNKENTVHHIDKNIHNNNIENLLVFETNKEHKQYHNSKFAHIYYNETNHKFSCKIKERLD